MVSFQGSKGYFFYGNRQLRFLQLFLILSCIFGVLAEVSAQPDGGQQTGRVLHFPKDRSLGRVMLQDANSSRGLTSFHYSGNDVDWYENPEFLSQAQGDIIIPAGKIAALFVNSEGGQDLSPLSKLPPDSLYMLSVDFLPFGNNCMPHIAHLTGLKDLQLSGAKITSDGLKYLVKLQSLERLMLPDGTTNRGLYFASKLKNLKGLMFYQSRATAKGLEILAKSQSLEELSFHSEILGDDDLKHLANMKSLKFLALGGKKFGDASLVHISEIPSLKTLNLMHLPITDSGIARLSGHKTLENLGLYNTDVTNGCIKYLKTMPSLKKLDLGTSKAGQGYFPISDEGMPQIAHLVGLEHLTLPNRGITDKGMSHITSLKNLKFLWVSGASNSPLTDKSLRYVSELKKLEFLLMKGDGFTADGMEYLTRLSNLKKLVFGGDLITDEGVAKLNRLNSLEKLDLDGKKFTLSGLSKLNGLNNLLKLKVRGVRQDNSGMDISGLKKLNHLTLTLNKERKLVCDALCDKDLTCLKELKNLTSFGTGVYDCSSITDAGFAQLSGLTNMRTLAIGSAFLTDKSLGCLAGMKQLNTLNIGGNFTDNGLAHLKGLKALSRINLLSSGTFSRKALSSLQESFANMRSGSFNIEQNRKFKNNTNAFAIKAKPKKNAPLFAGKTLDGKDIKLEDYRGKAVILYFWATWCKPCVASTPKLKKQYLEMKKEFGEDFEMISLSMDRDDRQVRDHVSKYKLGWPQMRIGLSSRISADYGVNNTAPKYFLIGPDGKLLLGPDSPQVDEKALIRKVLNVK